MENGEVAGDGSVPETTSTSAQSLPTLDIAQANLPVGVMVNGHDAHTDQQRIMSNKCRSTSTSIYEDDNGSESPTSSLASSVNSPLSLSLGLSHRRRKLILHFDVRNTILVADSVTNINVEQALNSFLTGVTWGKVEDGVWCWSSDRPSLTAPSPDSVTYYKHLEQSIVHVPNDRAHLRQVTGDFSQEDIGKMFFPYFEKHLKHLEWPHGSSHDRILTMNGSDGKLYHYILPAFYKLLHYLQQTDREFAIVVRTYGMDAPNVLQSIKLTLEGKHPQFPTAHDISVNTEPGRIRRDSKEIILESPTPCDPENNVISVSHRQDSGITPHLKLTSELEMYQYLNEATGVSAFVDDFLHWQTDDYHHTCGKPLWIDPLDSHVHHIFFDDNIRVTDTDSIVDLRFIDSAASGNIRSLHRDEMIRFEDMCLVQADLLESTSNINYFINKVKICEENYAKYLSSFGKRRMSRGLSWPVA